MINFNECSIEYGAKPKITYYPYQRPGARYSGIFGLDLAFKNDGNNLYVLLTSLGNTAPSYVTNDMETIANLVYVSLRAQGFINDTTNIHWYELCLSDSDHPRRLDVSSVSFEYNGLTLERPKWHHTEESDYPFDLSDFSKVRPK